MAQFEIKDGIVIIPEGVTSLPDWAFVDNCSIIESLNIPKSVDSIGQYTFSDCPNMTSIIVSEDNEVYDSRNGCNAIIETDTNTLIVGCKTTVIPDSVTSIGDFAFEECSGLASVTIPNSVISIGNGAFSGCSGLASIKVSEDNDVYDSRNSCNAIIETDTNKLIVGCKTTIIPDSVTSIGNYAFNDCSDLKSITIPASVTNICDYTFSGCSGLASIKVSEDNDVYDSRNSCNAIIETDTNKLVAGCKTTVIPDSVTSIGDYAFFNCSNLTSITIPDSVTSIGRCAFYECSGLRSVTIPNSVTSIGDGAFSKCSGLTSVTIGNSVTSIGESVFWNCSGLTSVTIGNSVSSIGDYAFYGCSNITRIDCMAATPPLVYYDTFSSSIYTKATLNVPKGCAEAYQKADYWKKFIKITVILTEQCAAPVITYADGKLQFACETAGAECKYTLTAKDIQTAFITASNNSVDLTACYDITAYAVAEGYKNSEQVTATLYWINGSDVSTNINQTEMRGVMATCSGGIITVSGLTDGETVMFYDANGALLYTGTAQNGTISYAPSASGVIIVKIGTASIKVVN